MGEYAIRRSDGQKIKIGTCENLFYLRIEDADQVEWLPGNVHAGKDTGLRFRLPYPDEDHLGPGEYEDFRRGLRLYRTLVEDEREWTEDYAPPYVAEDPRPGYFQMHHQPSGLLLSVPCHHGTRLPDLGPHARVHWNGKGHSIELYAVKREAAGVVPIIRCRHCGNLWRDTWANVLPFVPGETLRARLAKHAEAKP